MTNEAFFTDHWNKYLELLKEQDKDVYFTEEYIKLYESDLDKPECFVYKEGERIFLFPFLKRRVGILDNGYFDFESAYGYGGPIANVKDKEFYKNAFIAFCSLAKEQKMIAGFVRFHPLLENQNMFLESNAVFLNRKTVLMDLTLSQEELWEKQIHLKHRNSIKKAEKAGLIFEADIELKNLSAFAQIYRQTMTNVKADSYYFFDDDYFNRIRQLKDKVFLGLVYLDKQIIAGALFFKYGCYGHYHLAGSKEEYQQFNPNNFLIYNAALYLKEKEAKQFHLGGGNSDSEKDGLFRFKERFSKQTASFYIGKFVIDEEEYAKVCSYWEKEKPQNKAIYKNLILKYRY